MGLDPIPMKDLQAMAKPGDEKKYSASEGWWTSNGNDKPTSGAGNGTNGRLRPDKR